MILSRLEDFLLGDFQSLPVRLESRANLGCRLFTIFRLKSSPRRYPLVQRTRRLWAEASREYMELTAILPSAVECPSLGRILFRCSIISPSGLEFSE